MTETTKTTKTGALSSHEEGAPKTNNFSCKDNTLQAENKKMDEAISGLMNIVDNPIDEEKPVTGMLKIKTAKEWAQEASMRPDPRRLWLSLWYEGEVCCLFADSNLGKSIYAVEIANFISEKDKVLYFDFELSDKQFQIRYTDDFGDLYQFSDNLLRAEIDPELLTLDNFEDNIIADIEQSALSQNVKILIIDNLTYLDNALEKGDSAGLLMMRLMQLKKQYGLSILVLAHTPKRALSAPITQNDLAGSKKLFNFFDSVFAIGQSAKDERLRYIKQIKTRSGAFEYGSENVLVAEIEKEGAWLHFKVVGSGSEKDHLREPTDKDKAQFETNVRDLKSEGKSLERIAEILGVSKSKIGRVCKKLNI